MNQTNEQPIRIPVQQAEDFTEDPFEEGFDEWKLGSKVAGAHLPPALVKAIFDKPFHYALRLRSGETIVFEGATLDDTGLWVTLTIGSTMEGTGMFPNAQRFNFDRGVDVRVSDIVWVADAPHGS